MADQRPPIYSIPVLDDQKHWMKQAIDDANTESMSHTKTLTTRDANGPSNNSRNGPDTRRFRSTSSSTTSTASGIHRKVMVEVPLQYVPSTFPGLTTRPSTRLAIHTSFPVYSPRELSKQYLSYHHQGSALTKQTRRWLPDVTCQLSASTAIRGRNGSTSGSANVQYRWDHIKCNTKRKVQNDVQYCKPQQLPPIIQRWSTTLHTGLGVSETELEGERIRGNYRHNHDISTPIDVATNQRAASGGRMTNVILPLSSINMGVATDMSHHQTSSSSLSIYLRSMASKSRHNGYYYQLPITLSHQQQIHIPTVMTSRRSQQSTLINVRSQCVAVFDNRSALTLNQPTVNVSLTLSPSKNPKSTSTIPHTPQREMARKMKQRKVLQDWTMNFGLNKMKDSVHPSIGVSFAVMIPNLWRFLWWSSSSSPSTTTESSHKLFDGSLQWKGGQGWQVGGWWTNKRNHPSTESGPQQPNWTRQIGVGVTMHKASKRFSSLSWIFSWTEGDFTLRIPILVSSVESARTVLYQQGLQIFYLSCLSTIIQDIITHYFMPGVLADQTTEGENYDYIAVWSQKVRQEAMMQQHFMEKQAKSRTELEVRKNGLVIQRAFMYVHQEVNDNMNETLSFHVDKIDEDRRFDVTIPLQFWLSPNESKLHLYGKRSCMLGFYDLTKAIIPSTEPNASNDIDSDALRTTTAPFNRMWIQYAYEGQLYEIVVNDDEEVELPDMQRSTNIEATNAVNM